MDEIEFERVGCGPDEDDEPNNAAQRVEFDDDDDEGTVITPEMLAQRAGNEGGASQGRTSRSSKAKGDDDANANDQDDDGDEEDDDESESDGDAEGDDARAAGADDDDEEDSAPAARRKPEELTVAELRDTEDIRQLRRSAVVGREVRDALGPAWLPQIERLKNYRAPSFAKAVVDFIETIADEDIDPVKLEEAAVALNEPAFQRFNQHLADNFAEDYVLQKYAAKYGVGPEEIARRLNGEVAPEHRAPAKASTSLEAQLEEWEQSDDSTMKRMAKEVRAYMGETLAGRQYREERERADAARTQQDNARKAQQLKGEFYMKLRDEAENVLKVAGIRPGRDGSAERLEYRKTLAYLIDEFDQNPECLKVAARAEKVFVDGGGALRDLKMSFVGAKFGELLTAYLNATRSTKGKKSKADGDRETRGNDRVPTREATKKQPPNVKGGSSGPRRNIPDKSKHAPGTDRYYDDMAARIDRNRERRGLPV